MHIKSLTAALLLFVAPLATPPVNASSCCDSAAFWNPGNPYSHCWDCCDADFDACHDGCVGLDDSDGDCSTPASCSDIEGYLACAAGCEDERDHCRVECDSCEWIEDPNQFAGVSDTGLWLRGGACAGLSALVEIATATMPASAEAVK